MIVNKPIARDLPGKPPGFAEEMVLESAKDLLGKLPLGDFKSAGNAERASGSNVSMMGD